MTDAAGASYLSCRRDPEMNLHRHRFLRSLSLATLSLIVAFTASIGSAMAANDPIDLDLYARLLEQHTRKVDAPVGVRVDYAGLARSTEWPRLVRQVERARPSRLDSDARAAFWINAYNILAIDLILKHYPVDSIKEIGSFFSPVWDIEVATIEGKARSLGHIEHDILRTMGDPRVHAAIVCASTSCPPLARTPFRAETLDADLATSMRTWLASPEKGLRIDRGARQVTISKIFDWFEEDFERDGGVLETIARYAPEPNALWLRAEGRKARVRHFDYDWSLNDFER